MNNFLPGTASLLDEVDKRLMVLLRDGRTLIGYLRAIDQYGKYKRRSLTLPSVIFNILLNAANLVLHKTVERIHASGKFGEIQRGVFVVRGENVVLCGEIVCSFVKTVISLVIYLVAL